MSEFKRPSKNRWIELLRKKWVLPAIYILIGSVLISGIVWYQAFSKSFFSQDGLEEELESLTTDFTGDFEEEEVEAVLQQDEIVMLPVSDDIQTEIVTKFYDYDAKEEEQKQGLTLYNNRYYQSTGVHIATEDGTPFDVVASLSGTVMEVKEDPLLGNIIIMSHGDEITTHYASLEEVAVDVGAEIKQGHKIGTAGKSLFNEESGIHVHFEINKNGVELNPEQFFNKPFSSLERYSTEEPEEEENNEETDEKEDSSEEDDEEDEGTPSEEEPVDEDKNAEVSFSITT